MLDPHEAYYSVFPPSATAAAATTSDICHHYITNVAVYKYTFTV